MHHTATWMVAWCLYTSASAEHHMKRKVELRQNGNLNIPLIITNSCPETIWPAVLTQGGTGPQTTGFVLTTGANKTMYVASDFQGRVWGRTNCSFNAQGKSTANGPSCSTGDCGGVLDCKSPGTPPSTLAEITMNGSSAQTFYDLSIVDGYNLPMALLMLDGSPGVSRSTTNPSCVASVGDLAPPNFNPYANNQQFLGTSSADPLSFETKLTASSVSSWCPWDLQLSPPQAPGSGVYPYPDTNIARPVFDPCLSACAKYNQDSYCCTGKYNGPNSCSPNYYSKAAKRVCPDAYSYAYDDQTSTFIVPAGAGFQVVFCPGGRSTNIIASKGTSAITHGNAPNGSQSSAAVGAAGKPMIDGVEVKMMLLALVLLGMLAWDLDVMLLSPA